MRLTRMLDPLIRMHKTRTNDLWTKLEAENNQLQKKNSVLHESNRVLANTARDWEDFAQNAWTTAVKGEGKALEELDGAQGEERWLWEGEKRAYRNMQVSMQVIGRSLGIHLDKPR